MAVGNEVVVKTSNHHDSGIAPWSFHWPSWQKEVAGKNHHGHVYSIHYSLLIGHCAH